MKKPDHENRPAPDEEPKKPIGPVIENAHATGDGSMGRDGNEPLVEKKESETKNDKENIHDGSY